MPVLNTRSEFERALSDVFFEFPDFRIVYKRDSKLMRACGFVLRVISGGKMSSFMTSFHTTIGKTLYVSDEWDRADDVSRTVTLRHEAVHMRQWKRLGWLTFCVAYLFLFFPVGIAYGRMRLEREAYEETLRTIEKFHGKSALLHPRRKDALVSMFTGPAYLWMWPFRRAVERWYDETVSKIISGN